MAKAESAANVECLNIDFMRYLVKQYSELGQWTSAFFWADAAAAAGSGMGQASGDDIWLLASAMLARGELHRAAHAVTTRGLHKRHLLCLGVVMRAFLAAKEPATALNMLEECDPALLEPRNTDQTHNRALAGVLVWQAKALSCLERREAAAEALASALRADCACYEALDLLLEQHALTPRQEMDLIEALPISQQLSAAEGILVRRAYHERIQRYTPSSAAAIPPPMDCPMSQEVETVRSRTLEASSCLARRLCGAAKWRQALAALRDPWGCVPVRAACLVELKKSAELFSFAHTLVDAYPQEWTSWFAVGCYYYLIGKSEFARRYLSKAKSLEPGAGCVWLLYGHSFARDSEHDQAMAAYFKASQLMTGCHLPPLYVGVECSLLNNPTMCAKFLARAAALDHGVDCSEPPGPDPERENKCRWGSVHALVHNAHVAHEAGAAAFAAGDFRAARTLLLRALDIARDEKDLDELDARWAPTLDALGHAGRALGRPNEGLTWHTRALSLRPARPQTLAAQALCLALLGRDADAARAAHAALARDPDLVVASTLLDAILERLDASQAVFGNDEIPQFPFPEVAVPPTPLTPATPRHDRTNTSDMSMSFD
ncbi:cell division cycle protein 16 homolog [Plodia interpunctella]|uniref:cell division cycle protein 16 homolog n=1 Tax=Plodia interpunctella TaxID=58824 RepID=UPI002367BFB8|nr:cell division cycle protein 16 homolog [Plodia interpunctella]